MSQRRRTAAERRAARARGVDRFGRPLPRTLGTNPRAARRSDGPQRGPSPTSPAATPGPTRAAVPRAAGPIPAESAAPADVPADRPQVAAIGGTGVPPGQPASPHHGSDRQGRQPDPEGVDERVLVGQGVVSYARDTPGAAPADG